MKKTVVFGLIVLLLAAWVGATVVKNPGNAIPHVQAAPALAVNTPRTNPGLRKWMANMVTWSFTNVTQNINVTLTDLTTGNTYPLAGNVPTAHNGSSYNLANNMGFTGSGGTDPVAVPVNLPFAGHQFKVTVATMDGKLSADSIPFTIVNPFSIATPAAGAVWLKGHMYNIATNPPGMSPTFGTGNLIVTLKATLQGSGGVFPVATTNWQYTQWAYTVPTNFGYSGNQFKIIITAQQTGEVFAESGLFTIN
jgi:hypothetical protein